MNQYKIAKKVARVYMSMNVDEIEQGLPTHKVDNLPDENDNEYEDESMYNIDNADDIPKHQTGRPDEVDYSDANPSFITPELDDDIVP